MGYLGFLVTQNGIQPINKKVKDMVNMTPQKIQKKVREFVGSVNYSMGMWYKLSHLLQPLTELVSNKVKFKWTDVEQKAFSEIKQIVTHNILLIHPYFKKLFDIHTNASDSYLGAVIVQDGKTIAFCVHKLTGPQTKYTVTEMN